MSGRDRNGSGHGSRGVDFLTGGYDPADYAGSSLCPEKYVGADV